jgi:hypothetical protein
MLVLRLNVNGSFDTSFGSNGITFTDFGIVTPPPDNRPRTGDSGEAIALQPDGKIVVAGEAVLGNGDYRFVIARFLNDITSNVARPTPFDFDGDRKADIAVFRPTSGVWYLNNSQNGFSATQFGLGSDKIVPADYDGDRKTDIAVFRKSADSSWYVLQSANNTFRAAQFGARNIEQAIVFDTPIPADYDGDGRADFAHYRHTDDLGEAGRFMILQSSSNAVRSLSWGNPSDTPVAEDYDGDGKTDVAVFRSGTWYVLKSSDNNMQAVAFGQAGDRLVPADYDGDGKADAAVFRGGVWYVQRSRDGFFGMQFGLASDLPVPADYDADGKTDVAVFRDGTWYLQRSAAGFLGFAFGEATDRAIPNAFIP